MQIIGGKYKSRRLIAPIGAITRPTLGRLRETVFNICQSQIEGANFLDLFAGSGAMGLEALSRGAAHVTFVEKNRMALKALYQNISLLKEEKNTTVFPIDVFACLNKLFEMQMLFDLIYVDPPYEKEMGKQVLIFFDSHSLLRKGGTLFIEDIALFDDCALHSLKLKSERKSGRATLSEFIV